MQNNRLTVIEKLDGHIAEVAASVGNWQNPTLRDPGLPDCQYIADRKISIPRPHLSNLKKLVRHLHTPESCKV